MAKKKTELYAAYKDLSIISFIKRSRQSKNCTKFLLVEFDPEDGLGVGGKTVS